MSIMLTVGWIACDYSWMGEKPVDTKKFPTRRLTTASAGKSERFIIFSGLIGLNLKNEGYIYIYVAG